jgi:putative transposase
MAWKQVNVKDQRKKFILATQESSFAEACRQFDISRTTGYKWQDRYEIEGEEGLNDRSKAPHSHPNAISKWMEEQVLEMKAKFSKLGPDKIYAKLMELDQNIAWPCSSSIGNIFDKNGLTVRRKLRKKVAANTPSAFNGEHPNEVWCMDFKGTLRTLDNKKYDPFTLTDSSSRYLIKCNILERNNFNNVWAILETAFYEFGLPDYVLSDNGPPFATVGAGRLSRLAINLIKAGVTPIWITPGKPQENGRHERMHGTMQSHLGNPAANSKQQLKTKLKEFQEYYNEERPHAALGQIPPVRIYTSSEREWKGRFQSPEYGEEYEKRKVQKCGRIRINGEKIFIGETFYQEYVGILEGEEGLSVYYGNVLLGVINKKNKLTFKRI